jgi:hypothetical protein
MRLVQIQHQTYGPRVAVVDEPRLRLVPQCSNVYELAQRAIVEGKKISQVIAENPPTESVEYEVIYRCAAAWRLLQPIHHPKDSAHLFVTGTGLTHKASADNRQSMHGEGSGVGVQGSGKTVETDSMKMYRMGLEGGRPAEGCIGASPEWFYKGTGSIVRAHCEPLDVPEHAEDGGEEAEIAGVYVIGPDGAPYRVGLVQGNEFSDHVMEARNYLYLAQSKLRACALGPEIVIDGDFSAVKGKAWVEREGKIIWAAPLASGEKSMCHSLANMEHHHFKHAEHRRAGDVHVHFFGADMFSFKDRLKLEDGDVMVVTFENFGRALRNPLRVNRAEEKLVTVKVL